MERGGGGWCAHLTCVTAPLTSLSQLRGMVIRRINDPASFRARSRLFIWIIMKRRVDPRRPRFDSHKVLWLDLAFVLTTVYVRN